MYKTEVCSMKLGIMISASNSSFDQVRPLYVTVASMFTVGFLFQLICISSLKKVKLSL
jgi:hypothetical protein